MEYRLELFLQITLDGRIACCYYGLSTLGSKDSTTAKLFEKMPNNYNDLPNARNFKYDDWKLGLKGLLNAIGNNLPRKSTLEQLCSDVFIASDARSRSNCVFNIKHPGRFAKRTPAHSCRPKTELRTAIWHTPQRTHMERWLHSFSEKNK